MEIIKQFINKVENLDLPLPQILLLFATSIFLRTFFENFTNSNNAGYFTSPVDTFLHYPLWYIGVFLSIIVILYLITKHDLKKIITFVAFGSFIILLPPLVDFIVYRFLGHPYNFIAGDYPTLVRHFIHLLFTTDAIGVGIKIEIIIAIIGVGAYIYMKTKNILHSFIGTFLAYVAIFFFLTIPVHVMTLVQTFQGTTIPTTPENVVSFYSLDPTDSLSVLNEDTPVQHYFSQKISISFLVSILVLLLVLAYRKNKRKFFSILHNARILRLLHWWFIDLLGAYFALAQSGVNRLPDIYIWLTMTALFVSIAMAWLFSVWENDEADIAIDSISNQERPLVKGLFSPHEWTTLKYMFLFFALLAGWLAGYTIFIYIILFILTYYYYSREAFRFKQYLVVSSFAVSLNTVFAFLAGFFAIQSNTNIGSLPFFILLGTFVIYFLVENVKNMKDIPGDRACGIRTFPVIFGKYASIGLSIFIIIAGALVGIFFHPPLDISIIGIIMLLCALYFLNKKPYREQPIFVLYIIFMAIVLVRLFFFT